MYARRRHNGWQPSRDRGTTRCGRNPEAGAIKVTDICDGVNGLHNRTEPGDRTFDTCPVAKRHDPVRGVSQGPERARGYIERTGVLDHQHPTRCACASYRERQSVRKAPEQIECEPPWREE